MKVESSLCEAGDAAEDLIGGFHPDEWLWVVVCDAQVGLNRFAQRVLRAVTPTSKLTLGEPRKPALDLIDPRRVRR